MTVAQRVARNSLVQLAGRGVTLAFSLGAVAIGSRYLGPDGFGDYQTVLAFLLLANVSDLGVSTIAVRHLSTNHRSPEDILANTMTIRLAFAAASALIAVLAAAVLRYDADVQAAIAVGAVSYPLLAMSGVFGSFFAANLRMQYATLGNVAQAAVTLAFVAAVAASGDGLIEMAAAYTAGVLANALVCIWFARRDVQPGLRWDGEYARRVVRDALPLGIAVLVITAYGRLDILLLGWLTDQETVGQYGFAYRVVDLAFPLSFFFVGSVYPLLSAYHDEGDHGGFGRLYQRSVDVLLLAGVALVTAIVLFAEPITRVVGGPSYAPAVVSMQVLALAIGLIWLSNLADHALIAAGRQSALLWIACGGLCVNLAINMALIPLYEARGAAIATVLTEAAVLVPALLLVARLCEAAPPASVALRLLPVAGVTAAVVLLLPFHWLLEAPIAAALFAAGVAAARIVSVDDVRLLLRPASRARLAAGAEASR